MTAIDSETGTVLITGPTGGLGRDLTLKLAGRPEPDRPDLLLVGRPGDRLNDITERARAAGATVEAVPCDLSRLADVRATAAAAKDRLAAVAVRPLRGPVGPSAEFSSDPAATDDDSAHAPTHAYAPRP